MKSKSLTAGLCCGERGRRQLVSVNCCGVPTQRRRPRPSSSRDFLRSFSARAELPVDIPLSGGNGVERDDTLLRRLGERRTKPHFDSSQEFIFDRDGLWMSNAVPSGFWKSEQNQAKYLDWLAVRLQIRRFSDWFRVRQQDFVKNGGRALLHEYYKDSPSAMLSTTYSQFRFWPFLFPHAPKHLWKSKASRRALFDYVILQNGLDNLPDDLYTLNLSDFEDCGGIAMLASHYKSSIPKAVVDLFPEFELDFRKFPRHPKTHFSDPENQIDFIKLAEKDLSIRNVEDWYRVSILQIRGIRGGKRLLKETSLYKALKMTYPEVKWLPWKFSSVVSKKASQRLLANIIRDIYTDAEVLEDFKHPALLFPGTQTRMELDVFLPRLYLAFEYQGEQHYHDVPFFGSSQLYQVRDEMKRTACREQGITLIEIPYWTKLDVISIRQVIAKTKREVTS